MALPEVRVGVGCFVIRGFELLMVQRAGSHGAGTWSLPGGHQEFGESPEDTSVRETREETGVAVDSVKRLSYVDNFMPDEGKHYITLFTSARFVVGDARVMEPLKCPQVTWVGFTMVRRLNLFAPLETYFRTFGFTELESEINLAARR